MHQTSTNDIPTENSRPQRHLLSRPLVLWIAGVLATGILQLPAVAQGGGLETLHPAGGGEIVHGTLENQPSQPDGMVFMLRNVHGHYGDKPVLGKLVKAKDGSSLAAFFTLNDKNFSHSPLAGMVIVATVRGRMMAAVLTDSVKRFPSTEPGMVRALMTAWHGAAGASGGPAAAPASGGKPSGRTTVVYVTKKLYPATGGDRSMTLDLPPLWKIISVGGGGATAEGPNGEFIGEGLIWQNLPQAMTSDLFRSYATMSNIMRQRNGRPPGTYQILSRQTLPRTQYTRGNGLMAHFTVDFHDGYCPCTGDASIGVAGPGALFVTESWIPSSLYNTEEGMIANIIKTARQNVHVISAESAADMERLRQQTARTEIQTQAINDRREASAQSYENQRNAFNNRNNVGGNYQTTGNSHFDDIDAGSEDMQNYILDRSVVQATSSRAYATFSDSFADDLVRNNPDKFETTTNRALQGRGEW